MIFKYLKILFILLVLILFVSLALVFDFKMNLFLFSVLISVFILNRNTGILWTLLLGLALDGISGFPFFSYTISLLLTFSLTRRFAARYVTQRTILGVLLANVSGAALFEISIFVFPYLLSLFTQGWKPVFYAVYFREGIYTVIAVLITFVIAQRFSPKLKGIVIS